MEATIEEASGESHQSCVDRLSGLTISGTYRVATRLGSGGMGDVYEAEHLRLGNAVAIKFLRAQALADPRSRDRFRHEACLAAAIESEHVVRVFDYGELDTGMPYLVMERLVGEDLRSLLAREGPLPVRRAVNIVMDACRGAGAAHRAGLVHRDLKPANLFVERKRDGTERTKVLDFGVAKAFERDATRPGALVGTVRYMAPEQLEDARAATPVSDVYALAAILYEALTGVPARGAESLEQLMFDIMRRDVPRPSLRRELPRALESAVVRGLARGPAKRFKNTDDFLQALAPFAFESNAHSRAGNRDKTAQDDTNELVTRRLRSRDARAWGLAIVACFAGFGGGWFARASHATQASQNHAPGRTPITASSAPPMRAGTSSAATETFAIASEAPTSTATARPSGTESRVELGVRRRSASLASLGTVPIGAAKTPRASRGRDQASLDKRFDLTDPYE